MADCSPHTKDRRSDAVSMINVLPLLVVAARAAPAAAP